MQLTLGPAHHARIRALDDLAGYRCVGVQLAASERTRRYAQTEDEASRSLTVLPGTYEEIPRRERMRRVVAFVDETRPDALIIDSPADPVQYRMGRHLQRQGGLGLTRWAATRTDNPRSAWKELLKGFVYRRWDGYLTTGTLAREYLETFRVPAERIATVGNPVDSAVLRAFDRSRPAAERQDSFLYVGRFLPYKNVERLAGAYLRYRESGGGWGLELVGFGETEARVREILAGAPDATLHGHLQLEALMELYSRCGALVLPSYEPWGLVVNEAMELGMPLLLAQTVGCHPELLEPGRNGYLVDGLCEQSIAEGLARMEATPAEQRRRMGEHSRARVSGQTPEAWADATVRLIETLR